MPTSKFSGSSRKLLAEHVEEGKIIFPGDGFDKAHVLPVKSDAEFHLEGIESDAIEMRPNEDEVKDGEEEEGFHHGEEEEEEMTTTKTWTWNVRRRKM
jgi:hypothetical protein